MAEKLEDSLKTRCDMHVPEIRIKLTAKLYFHKTAVQSTGTTVHATKTGVQATVSEVHAIGTGVQYRY